MKDLKEKLFNLMTVILRHLPGGEQRRCFHKSKNATRCIKHFNHWGKCEDAWKFKWKRRVYKL